VLFNAEKLGGQHQILTTKEHQLTGIEFASLESHFLPLPQRQAGRFPGMQIAIYRDIMAVNAPGKSTRQMANRRYLVCVILALAAICVLLLIARNGLKTPIVIGLVSCLLASFGLHKLVDPLLRQTHFQRGAGRSRRQSGRSRRRDFEPKKAK